MEGAQLDTSSRLLFQFHPEIVQNVDPTFIPIRQHNPQIDGVFVRCFGDVFQTFGPRFFPQILPERSFVEDRKPSIFN